MTLCLEYSDIIKYLLIYSYLFIHRFTIYKVHKPSKKKREKSSAKKERKATKTLAIVLGKIFANLVYISLYQFQINKLVFTKKKKEYKLTKICNLKAKKGKINFV